MIQECFPAIKYVYVGILFIFSFLALYSQHMEMIGFGSFFGIQAILTLLFCFDVFMDGNRYLKALTIEIPASAYMKSYMIYFPLYYVMVPAVILQFVSSLLMTMTYYFLKRNDKITSLSKENLNKINNYKFLSLVVTISVLFLIFSYFTQYDSIKGSINFSSGYKIFLLLIYLITLIFPIINLIYANDLSKLRFKITQ